MTQIIASLVNKTTAQVEAVSKTSATVVKHSRTVISECLLVGKTAAIVSTIQPSITVSVSTGSSSKTILSNIVTLARTKLSILTGSFFDKFNKSFPETLIFTDYFTPVLDKKPIDALSITDFARRSIAKPDISLLDFTDNFEKSVNYLRSYSDNYTVSEISDKLFNKIVPETVTITDTLSRVTSFDRVLTDTIKITDDLNGTAVDDDQNIQLIKTIGDGILLTETIAVPRTSDLGDGITGITDLHKISSSKSLISSYSLSDQLNRNVEFNRNLQNYTNLTDYNNFDYTKNSIDQVSPNEIHSIGATKTLTSNLGINDEDVYVVFFEKSLTEDYIDVTEINSLQVVKDLIQDRVLMSPELGTLNIQDYVGEYFLEDYIGRTYLLIVTYPLTYYDNFAVYDSFSKQLNISRSFTDTFTATDNLNGTTSLDDDQTITLFKNISDYYSISEQLSYRVDWYRSLLETTNISDITSVGISKEFINTALATETTYVDLSKSLNSSSNITEEKYLDITKSLTDTNEISENIGKGIVKRILLERFELTDYNFFNVIKAITDVPKISEQKYLDLYKTVQQNTYNVSEQKYIGYLKNLTDQVNFTDDINGAAIDDDQNITFFKIVPETQFIQDLFDRTVIYSRNITDTADILEQKSIGYYKPLTNSYNVTDQSNYDFYKVLVDETNILTIFDRTVQYSRNITDTADILEQKSIDYYKTLTNSYNVTDQSNYDFYKVLADQTNILSIFDRTVQYSRNITDITSISDSRLLDYYKVNTDVLNLQDSSSIDYYKVLVNQTNILSIFDRTVQYSRNITDTTSISDSRLLDYYKVNTDVLNLQDSSSIHYYKVLADQTNILTIFDRTVQYSRNITDTASISDSRLLNYYKVNTDVLNLQDSSSIDYYKVSSDYTQVSDSRMYEIGKSLIDAANTSEQKYIGYLKNLTDQVSVTDDINGAAVDDDQNITFFKIVPETQFVQDLFNRNVVYSRTITDSADIFDITLLDYYKVNTDALNLQDNSNIDYYKVSSDSAQVSDTKISEIGKPVVDNYTISELISREQVKILQDTTNVSETIFGSVNKNLADPTTFSSAFEKTLEYNRTFTDAYILIEQISIGSSNVITEIINTSDAATLGVDKVLSDDVVDLSSDSFDRSVQYNRNFTDTNYITDLAIIGGSVVLSDIATIRDNEFRKAFNRAINTDSYSVTDFSYLSNNKRPEDYLSISDGNILNINKILSDTTNFTDDVNGALLDDDQNIYSIKVLSNQYNLSDNLRFTYLKDLIPQGTNQDVTFDTGGGIVVQDYAFDYFGEYYTGTQTVFT